MLTMPSAPKPAAQHASRHTPRSPQGTRQRGNPAVAIMLESPGSKVHRHSAPFLSVMMAIAPLCLEVVILGGGMMARGGMWKGKLSSASFSVDMSLVHRVYWWEGGGGGGCRCSRYSTFLVLCGDASSMRLGEMGKMGVPCARWRYFVALRCSR